MQELNRSKYRARSVLGIVLRKAMSSGNTQFFSVSWDGMLYHHQSNYQPIEEKFLMRRYELIRQDDWFGDNISALLNSSLLILVMFNGL